VATQESIALFIAEWSSVMPSPTAPNDFTLKSLATKDKLLIQQHKTTANNFFII
jgi:hypothetical protein